MFEFLKKDNTALEQRLAELELRVAELEKLKKKLSTDAK